MEAEQEEPTFTKLILGKTWSNTRRFFKSVKRDLLITILPAIAGFAAFCAFKGIAMALEDLATAAAFTFGPIGFACVVVMLWYFIIAPAELAYEAAAAQAKRVVVQTEMRPMSPDYQIWRQRDFYLAREFAALLDDVDPAGSQTTARVNALLGLVVEAMRQKNLTYVQRWIFGYSGNRTEKLPDENTKIPKDAAIAWADSHNFPIQKLK